MKLLKVTTNNVTEGIFCYISVFLFCWKNFEHDGDTTGNVRLNILVVDFDEWILFILKPHTTTAS